MSYRKPNFFIVGAPRCGTTAMLTYLREHPEIFLPKGYFEPIFFAKDLESPLFIRDEKQYASLFNEVGNEKRVGEKSAWYLYSKTAASEISKFCPHAKIVIMLRNPVDMMYSLFFYNRYMGYEDVHDFGEAIMLEADRKENRAIPQHIHFQGRLFYSDIACYADQVERYLSIFGKNNVQIILFDDFRDHIARVYKETLQFLGVRSDFQIYFHPINLDKHVRSSVLRDFYRYPHPYIMAAARRLLPKYVRKRIMGYLKKSTMSMPYVSLWIMI